MVPARIDGKPGSKKVLLGNEAVARGFVEAGIQIAASYPGTPSVEVMRSLEEAAPVFGYKTQWSVNEKVAAEVSIAASMCNMRTMVSMKGVGVNVASEPFQSYTYMGAEGGIVLFTGDDPSSHSSHNEQDNRLFARQAYLPVFEPYDPIEAKEMAKAALELSEKWGQPVMLRTTTQVSHTSAAVPLGEVPKIEMDGKFLPQPQRWVPLPQNSRVLRKKMIERLDMIQDEVSSLPFNWVEGATGDVDVGIIASGVAYVAAREALDILGMTDEVALLKVGTPYPVPAKLVHALLARCKRILVVEELEPLVQMQVSSIACASDEGTHTRSIVGKEFIPLQGELLVDNVLPALCRFFDIPLPGEFQPREDLLSKASELSPARPPVLCAGCGHRSAFFAMNVLEKELKLPKDESIIKPSDIGCYSLGYFPPLKGVDTTLCMGASIGISDGISFATGEPIITTIGDSTFFHSGIPPLINAVQYGLDITVLILDNGTTAMTGHQPHPGVDPKQFGTQGKQVLIEEMAKGCGVEFVRGVDAFDLDEMIPVIREAFEHKGPSVVVIKGPCALMELRRLRKEGKPPEVYHIDKEKCVNCRLCILRLGCPAFAVIDDEVMILEHLCAGCGVCGSDYLCPNDAIIKGACDDADGGEQ